MGLVREREKLNGGELLKVLQEVIKRYPEFGTETGPGSEIDGKLL